MCRVGPARETHNLISRLVCCDLRHHEYLILDMHAAREKYKNMPFIRLESFIENYSGVLWGIIFWNSFSIDLGGYFQRKIWVFKRASLSNQQRTCSANGETMWQHCLLSSRFTLPCLEHISTPATDVSIQRNLQRWGINKCGWAVLINRSFGRTWRRQQGLSTELCRRWNCL